MIDEKNSWIEDIVDISWFYTLVSTAFTVFFIFIGLLFLDIFCMELFILFIVMIIMAATLYFKLERKFNPQKNRRSNNLEGDSFYNTENENDINVKCLNCGEIVSIFNIRCPNCGKKIDNNHDYLETVDKDVEYMKNGGIKCNHCGAINTDYAIRCRLCGSKLKKSKK